jgi:uncharacterized membrane protein YbhN (UPF0104 family)
MIQGVGIGAKISLLSKKNVSSPQSIATVMLEILFDIIVTGIIASIYLSKVLIVNDGILKVLIGIVVIFALVLVFFRENFWLKKFISSMRQSLGFRQIIANLSLTAAIWLSASMTLLMLLMSFGTELNLSNVWRTLAAQATGFVLGLITLIPGGIGIRDMTWAVVLEKGGISLPVASVAALMMRILSIASVVMILFLISLLHSRWKAMTDS